MIVEMPRPRAFRNPDRRLAVAADFPPVADLRRGVEAVLAPLRRALEKRGEMLDAAEINIVYPQKHPRRQPDHANRAAPVAAALAMALRTACPATRWVLAQAFFEERSLARAHDQSVLHTLTARQVYGADPGLQDAFMPFLYSDAPQAGYCLMVDGAFWQGTTLANFASFLRHNGGTVLAAAAQSFGDRSACLAQQESSSGALGRAFAASAAREGLALEPAECLSLFDAVLAPHGRAAASLTDGECLELIETVGRAQADRYNRVPLSFGTLCRQLRNMPPAP